MGLLGFAHGVAEFVDEVQMQAGLGCDGRANIDEVGFGVKESLVVHCLFGFAMSEVYSTKVVECVHVAYAVVCMTIDCPRD